MLLKVDIIHSKIDAQEVICFVWCYSDLAAIHRKLDEMANYEEELSRQLSWTCTIESPSTPASSNRPHAKSTGDLHPTQLGVFSRFYALPSKSYKWLPIVDATVSSMKPPVKLVSRRDFPAVSICSRHPGVIVRYTLNQPNFRSKEVAR